MTISPMQAHRERIKQLQKQESKNNPLLDATQSLHLLTPELQRDIDHLRTLPTLADRQEYKKTVLLPKWKPQAQAHIDSQSQKQNVIFAVCIVWLFDVGEYDEGIDWALIAIEQGQVTPEFIKRNFPTFVADQILEFCEKALENGNAVEPYFSRVFDLIRNKWRLHEEITAKWYKFAGYLILRDNEGKVRATAVDDATKLNQAKEYLEQAQNLYDKIGVKTKLSDIEARINALTNG